MASHDVHLHVDQTSMMHSWLGRERVRLSRSPWFRVFSKMQTSQKDKTVATHDLRAKYRRSREPDIQNTPSCKLRIHHLPLCLHPLIHLSSRSIASSNPSSLIASHTQITTFQTTIHNTQHTPSAKPGAHQVIQQSKNLHRNIENRIPEDTFISQ